MSSRKFAENFNELEGLDKIAFFAKAFGYENAIDENAIVEIARKNAELEGDKSEVIEELAYSYPLTLYKTFFPNRVASVFNEPFGAFAEDELEETFLCCWHKMSKLTDGKMLVEKLSSKLDSNGDDYTVTLNLSINGEEHNFSYEIDNSYLDDYIFEQGKSLIEKFTGNTIFVDSFSDDSSIQIAYVTKQQAKYIDKLFEDMEF